MDAIAKKHDVVVFNQQALLFSRCWLRFKNQIDCLAKARFEEEVAFDTKYVSEPCRKEGYAITHNAEAGIVGVHGNLYFLGLKRDIFF